jgi:hypothetical protein
VAAVGDGRRQEAARTFGEHRAGTREVEGREKMGGRASSPPRGTPGGLARRREAAERRRGGGLRPGNGGGGASARMLGFRAYGGGCGLREEPLGYGGTYRRAAGHVDVRARGGGRGESAGASRTQVRVRCGGDERPDRRAPPVSAREKEGGAHALVGWAAAGGLRAGEKGETGGERGGRGPGCKEVKERKRREREWARWAGPKGEKARETINAIQIFSLNLKPQNLNPNEPQPMKQCKGHQIDISYISLYLFL